MCQQDTEPDETSLASLCLLSDLDRDRIQGGLVGHHKRGLGIDTKQNCSHVRSHFILLTIPKLSTNTNMPHKHKTEALKQIKTNPSTTYLHHLHRPVWIIAGQLEIMKEPIHASTNTQHTIHLGHMVMEMVACSRAEIQRQPRRVNRDEWLGVLILILAVRENKFLQNHVIADIHQNGLPLLTREHGRFKIERANGLSVRGQ